MTGPLFGRAPSTGVLAPSPSGPADAAQAAAILFLHSRESVPVLDELSDLGDPCLRRQGANGLESGNGGLRPQESIAPAPTTTLQPRTYYFVRTPVMTPTDGTPDPQRLKALVRSIVSTAAPERIILFGSAARGDMHADSDERRMPRHLCSHRAGRRQDPL